jgi:hypothetical protein
VWGTFAWDELQYLEKLLQYFHVTCKLKWEEKLKPPARTMFLANVDVAATDAFYAARPLAGKKQLEKTKKALIAAVTKYALEIGPPAGSPESEDSWIVFDWGQCGTATTVGTTSVTKPPLVAPKVITFDEKTGECITQQNEFPQTQLPAGETKATSLPWREWRNLSQDMGATEADHASAVAALQHLHAMFPVEDEHIDVMLKDDKIYVCANQDVDTHSISLPPCIPKQSKVHERSEHPHAVKFVMKTLRKDYVIADESEPAVAAKPKDTASDDVSKETAVAADKKESKKSHLRHSTEKTGSAPNGGKSRSSNGTGSVGNVHRETSFYVLPEFKSPVAQPTKPQQAESTQDSTTEKNESSSTEKNESPSPSWQWGDGGAETMHPFWAVRRLTASQLIKEQEKTKLGYPQSRFNCELKEFQMSLVNIAAPKDKCINLTRILHMQLLTNSIPLRKGEELILEVAAKGKRVESSGKRTWRDAHHESVKDAKKLGKKPNVTQQ